MLFSSNTFLFGFLPAVVVLYYLCPRRCRNVLLLVASLIFYGWGEPKYVLLMLVSILLNYFCGAKAARVLIMTISAAMVIIMLLLGIVLAFDLYFCRMMSGQGAVYRIFSYIFVAALFVYAMLFLWIYPVLAKFFNTTKNLFRNSILMSIRHLPYTILMMVITAAPVLLGIFVAQAFPFMILFYIMLGFATVAYMNSRFFVKLFDNYIPEDAGKDTEENGEEKAFMMRAFDNANRAVYEKATSDPEVLGMGTTGVCALQRGNLAHIVHAGDSRAYLWHGGAIRQLTRDHSMVQQLVDSGLVRTAADLYSLRPEQIEVLDRMGKKSAQNAVEAIARSREDDLWRLIFALGIRQVGEKAAKTLAAHFGSMDALMAATEEALTEITVGRIIIARTITALSTLAPPVN